MSLSDEQLIQKFVEQGDQDAFQQVHARHAENLAGFLSGRYFNNDMALAEDAVQSAFLKLAQQAATLDLSEPLRPWLYLVASNAAIDIQRSRSRRPTASLSQMMSGYNDLFNTEYSYDLEDTDTVDSTSAAISNETQSEIKTIIAQLSEGDRAALDAVYVDGLSFTEAAERLDIPVGTLKTRINRSLGVLRNRVAA